MCIGSFDNASGGAPVSRLLLHNGLLYGTTSAYGKGDGYGVRAWGGRRGSYGTVFSDKP